MSHCEIIDGIVDCQCCQTVGRAWRYEHSRHNNTITSSSSYYYCVGHGNLYRANTTQCHRASHNNDAGFYCNAGAYIAPEPVATASTVSLCPPMPPHLRTLLSDSIMGSGQCHRGWNENLMTSRGPGGIPALQQNPGIFTTTVISPRGQLDGSHGRA